MTEATDWAQSADAWMAHLAGGELTRAHVLDGPMMDHVRATGAETALDLGCGEGRFCRMMAKQGLRVTGIDPTTQLLDAARSQSPDIRYDVGVAEDLPYEDGQFDLVVSYISFVDIPDYQRAIAEVARVLKPGGTFLIAHLHGFATARPRDLDTEKSNWIEEDGVPLHFAMDDYTLERSYWVAWKGIRIRNYHRPLSAYMASLLDAGLILKAFEDPPYTGPDAAAGARFARAPWAYLMAWTKPE